MIKSITFENFRNINGKYDFEKNFNIVVGKNNSGKTNLIKGIQLAFSQITGDYFKIDKTDFAESDDTKKIKITVELTENAIPSLNCFLENETNVCGFIVRINKNQKGRYVKTISLLNNAHIDKNILESDDKLPNIKFLPTLRISDIINPRLELDVNDFIRNSEEYNNAIKNYQDKVSELMKEETEKFEKTCKQFGNDMSLGLKITEMNKEKLVVADGDMPHNENIGDGYKSLINIIFNSSQENTILLIDEIENHMHPSLIRYVIRSLKKQEKVEIIGTSHSSVVINECSLDNLININGERFDKLKEKKKLDKFLSPGRNEMILADNILLVEGYSEEIIFNDYLRKNNKNWTIINVAGVMFEPYIELGKLLNKNMVVLTDKDFVNDDDIPSERYKKLEEYCDNSKVKIIGTYNTLETDLYRSGFIDDKNLTLKTFKTGESKKYFVAKNKQKTEIASKLIMDDINLDSWEIIKEIKEVLDGSV